MSHRTAKESRTGRASFAFLGDDDTGLHSSSANSVELMAGGTVVQKIASTQRGARWAKLAIVGAGGSTGVFASVVNPFGEAVVITRAVLDITTQSSIASTLDIGVASNATTSNDTLIDGLSGAATGVFDNTKNGGTNGKGSVKLGDTQFVNVAEASGDVNALVATLYLEAIPAF
jgi:hypothetical protein